MRESSLEFEELVDLASGDLDATSQAALEAQLRHDPRRGAVLRQLRELIRLMPELADAPASAAARQRSLALFRRYQRALRLRGMVDAARHAVARLVFDSRERPAAAGFRGDASSTQLAFESPVGRIDLHITPIPQDAEERWRIRGQLAASGRLDDGLASLVVHPGGDLATHADVDAHGRFNLDAPCGRYDLIVAADEDESPLVVSGIEVGWSGPR